MKGLEEEVLAEQRRTAVARKEGFYLRRQVQTVRAEITQTSFRIAQCAERSAARTPPNEAVAAREVEEGRAEVRRWKDQARSLEDRIAQVRAEDAKRRGGSESGLTCRYAHAADSPPPL